MNRFNKLLFLYKEAVNKENQELREAFAEKFTGQQLGKVNSLADQWYKTFNGTELYEQWNFIENLDGIVEWIRSNKDSVEKVVEAPIDINLQKLKNLYPNLEGEFDKFNEQFLSWIVSRYGEAPKDPSKYPIEIQPIEHALITLEKYQKSLEGLKQKYKQNEEYRSLYNERVSNSSSPKQIMELTIDNMETAMALSKRDKAIHTYIDKDYKPEEFIGQSGPWKLWMPLTMKDSIKISQFCEKTLEPETTWCTARTSGNNLFYNYAGKGIILFYAVKDGGRGVNDYQSIGYSNGEFIYEGDGGATVNRDNKGMDEEDHEEIFGKDIKEDIYKAIRSKGGETKVHPAQKLMDEAAMGDPDAKEELYRGVSGEDRHDLEDSILDRSSKLVSSIFTPPEILSKMERSIAKDLEKENLEEGGNWSQRGTAHDLYLKMASNESLSLESLENIYDFKSTYVREKIISNPSMPLESAIKKIELASDEPRRISMEFFETTKPNDPKIIIPKARMLRALSLRDDAPLDYILDSLYKLPKVVGYNDIPEDNKPGTMQDKLDTYINLIHKAKSSDELMKIYESIKHNASSDVPVSKIIHRFVDNKQCPPEILDEIISIFSEGDFLRFLRKTNSSGKEEIKAVAQHPNTNIGMLNKLEDLIAPPGYKGWEDGNIDHVNARRDLAKKLLLNKNITQEFVNDLYSRLYRDPKIALYDRQKIISTAEIIPREMLDELAASSSFEVKKNLAENKSTTPEILNDLFEETKVPGDRRIANQIRNKIANNPSISPELANKIFDDYLAARESTDTFQALRNRFTPAWNVSPVHLSKNPAIKEDLMMRIADNEIVREEAPNVLGFLVNNPSATPNVIAKIASLNISKDIKLSIAANKKTPVSILQNLAENPERPIRWAAQKTLRDLSANKNELTYEEGQVSDTKLASLIKWLINSGFKKEADEIDLLLKEAAKKKKKKSKKKKDRTPTKPELWSASKAWAKRKYDVWPSAYAVGAALKRYKEKGGGWRGPKPKK